MDLTPRFASTALSRLAAIALLATACTPPTSPDPGVGDLEVTTATTGGAQDPDGYVVSVPGVTPSPISTNGSVLFPGVPARSLAVELSGLAPNCQVAGANPATVEVPTDARATLGFSINCVPSGILVRTRTSGPPAESTGWSVELDGGDARSIAPDGEVRYETTPGAHAIQLGGVPENCTPEGANPRTVDAPPGGDVTTTFDVTCEAGDLTVTVTTEGDPDPATSYVVLAFDRTSPVPVDGEVTFRDLPAVNHTVQLDGVPGHCTVEGANPRQVDAPGGTAFRVVCPLQCTAPPWEPVISTETGMNSEEYAWSSGLAEVVVADYGEIELRGTARDNSGDGWGTNSYYAMVAWQDPIFLSPADPSRLGERVNLRYRHQARADLSNSTPGAGQLDLSPPSGKRFRLGLTGNPITLEVDEVEDVNEGLILGQWGGMGGGATLNVWTEGQVSATLSSRVTLLEVVDLNGLPVPMARICTGSGARYGL